MVVPGGAWPALAPGPTDRGTRMHGADPFEWSGLGSMVHFRKVMQD